MNQDVLLEVKQPLLDLMQSCETFCVAACCGAGAFDTSEGQIEEWVKANGAARAEEACQHLRSMIAEIDGMGPSVVLDVIYENRPGQEWISWLNQWKTGLEKARQKVD